MTTIKQYISTKLQRFNIALSDVELDVALHDAGLNGGDNYTTSVSTQIKQLFVSIIPELLLTSEVSEGDLTIRMNVDGVKAYYSMLCKELGVDNALTPVPTITDRSNLW